MTPRLQAARAEVARLIERYMRPFVAGRDAMVAAIAELEAAARVEDDQPSDPPVTLVDPLAEALKREGVELVHPQSPPSAPPELPTVGEAVADALAPHDVTPEKGAEDAKPSKRKKA